MSVRQVYSCDWCEKDSPTPGSIGGDWKVEVKPGTSSEAKHLCPDCHKAWREAWEAARAARFRVTHPLADRDPQRA